MAISTSDICPFTLKSLASTKPEDVAIIYASESNPLFKKANCDGALQCSHSCTLSPPLISYLHDTSGSKKCPVCQDSPANVVCDGISSAYLISQTINQDGALDNNNGRIISFRYGNISYYLWVYTTESIQSTSYTNRIFSGRKRTNALHRIGDVLHIEFTNIKVIHKGKIFRPSDAKSESLDDISEQMLDVSSADILHKRKKPTLVVMGSRQQTKIMEKQRPICSIQLQVS